MTRRAPLLWMFLLLLLLGAAPRAARACSPPRCSAGTVLPAGGATVPANLPALVFSPARGAVGAAGGTDGFELLGPDGRAVAVTFTPAGNGLSFLAMPAGPLEAGKTYRVRFPQVCVAGVPGGASTAEQSFTTGAAVAAPSTIGTASMTSHRLLTITVPTVSGSCTAPIGAAVAGVTIAPSPELRAYLPLAQVTATVDGTPAPVINYRAPVSGGPIELEVYAACRAADPGASKGLTPGRHKLQIDAHLPGASGDPLPIWTDVELRCDGGDEVGASGGGCSVGGAAGGVGWWPALLAVLWRRRRAR